jgi:hypothetical protein
MIALATTPRFKACANPRPVCMQINALQTGMVPVRARTSLGNGKWLPQRLADDRE